MRSRTVLYRTVSWMVLAMGMAAAPQALAANSGGALSSPTPGAVPLAGLANEPDTGIRVRLAQAETYEWSAVKSAEGIVLSGDVPTEAARSFFGVRAGDVPTQGMTVADGAPENFIANSLAGLDALNSLDTGRVAYTGSRWVLGGTAATEAQRDAIVAAFSQAVDPATWMISVEVGTPEETDAVAEAAEESEADNVAPDEAGPADEVDAPRYTWAVRKPAEGALIVSGMVPTAQMQSYLDERDNGGLDNRTEVSDVAPPDDFFRIALAGLDAVARLDQGRIGYTGTQWTFGGFAADAATLEAVRSEMGEVADLSDWFLALEVRPAEPVTETAEPETEATPDAPSPDTAEAETSADAQDSAEIQDSAEVQESADTQESGEAQESGAAQDSGDTQGAEPDGEPPVTADTESDAREPADTDAQGQPDDATSPAPEPVDPDYSFAASRSGNGPVMLEGDVPADAFVDYAGVIAGDVDGDDVTINAPAPEGFTRSAAAGLRALGELSEGQLAFTEGQWSLSGQAAGQEAADMASGLVGALPNADAWALDIAMLPPFEMCARAVADFSNTHTILFAPASARLTGESAEALDDLVADLRGCPAARLNIEGHTDSDGAQDANLALSVARAEAVVSELVDLGLDATRLYAIGYGESLPVADNDTAAGKARNRRIVFELVEGD